MAILAPALGVILLAWATASAAQRAPAPAAPTPARHLNALDACRVITADTARLACFDREAAALLTASRSGELSVVDRADMRTARRSLFGFALPKLPFFAGDKSGDEVPDTLASTVVAAQGIGNDLYRIRIAAGDAIWETTDSRLNLSAPRPGEKIVIRKGALGSYFVRINGQTGVKGRRIK